MFQISVKAKPFWVERMDHDGRESNMWSVLDSLGNDVINFWMLDTASEVEVKAESIRKTEAVIEER